MLSIPHLIIIFAVALIVFGPEKLPELARTLGKVMAEFRRATGDLRSTFEDHLRDIEREAEQRRIGGSLPAVKPAEGAVPASAPTSAAAAGEPGSAASETHSSSESGGLPPGSSEAVHNEATSTSGTSAPDPEHARAHPSEPDPEVVSDGGARPA